MFPSLIGLRKTTDGSEGKGNSLSVSIPHRIEKNMCFPGRENAIFLVSIPHRIEKNSGWGDAFSNSLKFPSLIGLRKTLCFPLGSPELA